MLCATSSAQGIPSSVFSNAESPRTLSSVCMFDLAVVADIRQISAVVYGVDIQIKGKQYSYTFSSTAYKQLPRRQEL